MHRRTKLPASLAPLALAALVTALGASSCVARDVAALEPSTKTSFQVVVPQQSVDKIDLLLVIDDSYSMADKQRILADAVPDLVRGIVEPRCRDLTTRAFTGVRANPRVDARDACPAGSEPEFTPITDMHVGVLGTSLGGPSFTGRSGTRTLGCAGVSGAPRGHLVSSGAGGARLAEAGPHGFLSFYPDVPKNQDKTRHPEPEGPAIRDPEALSRAISAAVVGVGQRGCGLEAQLEVAYRFLSQPDPWPEIALRDERAAYPPDGVVDEELLAQRAAFLRPDSLVAVVMLTDEDDAWVDPLALRGSAWRFSDATFGFEDGAGAYRGTAACAASPGSSACTSCGFDASLPGCAPARYTVEEDDLNVRFHDMKRRFGVDPRMPIERYVAGLTAARLPRRSAEHDEGGAYRPKATCTNPLFAARLPSSAREELCDLPVGGRTRDLVYFAIIGGVPRALLPRTGGAEAIDWVKILGRDPDKHDESGVDAHMLQRTTPRPGLPPPASGPGTDPEHGREWDTRGSDLQYACTFDLVQQTATGTAPLRVACEDARLCDCPGDGRSPLCDPADPKVQVKGKAYPTVRELRLAKELADHAVVASLCPQQLTDPRADDYGYRPAARAIVDRLAEGLVSQCLPRKLTPSADGSVSCVVLAALPDAEPPSACQARFGLSAAAPELLAQLAKESPSLASRPVCVVPQIVVPRGDSCARSDAMGFCYTEGASARCGSSLQLTQATSRLFGARFTLHCIQQEGTR